MVCTGEVLEDAVVVVVAVVVAAAVVVVVVVVVVDGIVLYGLNGFGSVGSQPA